MVMLKKKENLEAIEKFREFEIEGREVCGRMLACFMRNAYDQSVHSNYHGAIGNLLTYVGAACL